MLVCHSSERTAGNTTFCCSGITGCFWCLRLNTRRVVTKTKPEKFRYQEDHHYYDTCNMNCNEYDGKVGHWSEFDKFQEKIIYRLLGFLGNHNVGLYLGCGRGWAALPGSQQSLCKHWVPVSMADFSAESMWILHKNLHSNFGADYSNVKTTRTKYII